VVGQVQQRGGQRQGASTGGRRWRTAGRADTDQHQAMFSVVTAEQPLEVAAHRRLQDS